MLIMNNEIRELAYNRASASQLRKAARASGMKPLLEDGKRKILDGTTTMEEISRVHCRIFRRDGERYQGRRGPDHPRGSYGMGLDVRRRPQSQSAPNGGKR